MALGLDPAIQTSKVGTVLYLQSRANGHTARIGMDTHWGGAIVDISLDGAQYVNAHDTGRAVQPALDDGAAQYPWPDISTAYGWDPVLAGDVNGNGGPVPVQQVTARSQYTQATPL